MLTMFTEGGWPMYVVAGIDACSGLIVPIALIVAIAARLKNKWRGLSLGLGILALAVSLLPICAGVGGYFYSMQMVESAVNSADPEMRKQLLALGTAEASQNINFGVGSGCCCLLPAVLALMLVPPKPVNYDDFG